MSELPLDGLRVIDLTRLLPGGYASLILMELGAEVIKIEEVAGGDGVRTMFSQAEEGESGAHLVLSRGKKSMAIDLKDVRGQAVLKKLLGTADVLLDSFRPGVLDRLGLSKTELSQANPRLVHVSITAFGPDSALASQPTHDLNAQGYAGTLGLTADGDGNPVIPGVQISDLSSGLQAVVAVLAGLRRMEKSGEGFRADVSMTDSAMSMLMLPASVMLSTGESPKPPDMFTGQLACYRLYECQDSEWITVGGLEPKFFSKMVNLLERPDLAPLQYDFSAQDQLHAELEQIFKQRSRIEWIELLGLADTCVGPVYSIAEALADPDAVIRGAVRSAEYRDGRKVKVPAAVHWVDPDSQSALAAKAPLLGEDSLEFLGELGIPREDIDSLIESGIVRPSE
ncbi:MAG: CaiB/BaiF CoA-transferase family protein [Candidatus Nanopelagicales bacterium]